jgi:hypothetical protein
MAVIFLILVDPSMPVLFFNSKVIDSPFSRRAAQIIRTFLRAAPVQELIQQAR